jgi:hypothetical protein
MTQMTQNMTQNMQNLGKLPIHHATKSFTIESSSTKPENILNKSEIRETQKLAAWHAAGVPADIIARSMSALIRAARTNKSAAALRAHADAMGVTGHPEFIC